MNKKILLLIITIFTTVLFALSVNAIVPEDNAVMPCWESIGTIGLDIGFSDGVGTSTLTVSRIYGVTTSIEATLEVYRKTASGWIYIGETSGSSTRSLGLEFEFDATEGATYKAIAYVTAYSADGPESETITEIVTY